MAYFFLLSVSPDSNKKVRELSEKYPLVGPLRLEIQLATKELDADPLWDGEEDPQE